MGRKNFSFTWRGQDPTRPTAWEMHRSCVANAEEAALLFAEAERRFEASAGGTNECLQAKQDMDRYASDQKHWRRMARDYEAEARAEEGRPPPLEPLPAAPAAPAADRRLPAEQDPDDISTFAPEQEDLRHQRDPGDDELEPGEDWSRAS